MQDDSQNLALRYYPALRLSLPYTTTPLRLKLLALYELLATVEESICRASDPVVSRARLAWWLEELRKARTNSGNHPLSKLLQSSSALIHFPDDLVNRLMLMAENRLDASGLKDEEGLKALCERLGMMQLEFELALQDESVPDCPITRQWAAMNGLVQLLRESFKSKQASFFWLPLTTCARFGINRQSLVTNLYSPKSNALFAGLADMGLNWAPGSEPALSALGELSNTGLHNNRHWLLITNLQKRQLKRLKNGMSRKGFTGNPMDLIEKHDLLDAWSTWRLARSVNARRATV